MLLVRLPVTSAYVLGDSEVKCRFSTECGVITPNYQVVEASTVPLLNDRKLTFPSLSLHPYTHSGRPLVKRILPQ